MIVPISLLSFLLLRGPTCATASSQHCDSCQILQEAGNEDTVGMIQTQLHMQRAHHQGKNNSEQTAMLADESVPYYARACLQYDSAHTPALDEDGKIKAACVNPVKATSQMSWLLQHPLANPRRNHESLVFDGKTLVNILGRWAPSIEATDLITGDSWVKAIPQDMLDPANFPLADLNHVYGVVLDQLEDPSKREIWLPCGFHGNEINKEKSSLYARIIDVDTLQIRTGPKLLQAGGACSALAVHVDGPDNPPHICSFGGTDGSHDKGTFLNTAACYDRRHHVWNQPFGFLPMSFDHSNAIMVPASTCHAGDPAKILVMNFRISHYGNQRSEIFAFDLPSSGIGQKNVSHSNGWYLFANDTSGDVNLARDAAGAVQANNGRLIINIGGIHYYNHAFNRYRRFDDARVLDVCTRKWSMLGELPYEIFAVQTAASEQLGVAITCGGHRDEWKDLTSYDYPYCSVNRFPSSYTLINRP